jgi:hypothetical protein
MNTAHWLKIGGVIVLGTLWATLPGCPGSLQDPDRFVTACDAPAVISYYCSGSNCHSPDHESGGTSLVLVDVDPDSLVGKEATYDGVLAGGKGCPEEHEKIIDTANPENSLIIKKLEGRQTCGLSMPYTGVKLRKESKQCLLDWVRGLAGAADGGIGGGGGSAGNSGSAGIGGNGGTAGALPSSGAGGI